MSDFVDWLSVLGDTTRLRILRLIAQEELGVGELARIVQMPQSTISRHLKVLLESRWASKRPVGTASLYRLSGAGLDDDAQQVWSIARRRLEASEDAAADDARLKQVVAERDVDSRAFFGRLGGEWDQLRRDLFGDRFTSEALLALVNPEWVVADVGCGTGDAAEHLAPLVKRVIAIDREPAMLEAAKKRLGGGGGSVKFRNVEFRAGEAAALPLKDAEVDAAMFFLIMHHVDDPAAAVAEAARAMKPGGMVLIVDMIAHDREEYRHTMGHRHLGFSERDVKAWARRAALRLVRFIPLRPETSGKGPRLFAATMTATSGG